MSTFIPASRAGVTAPTRSAKAEVDTSVSDVSYETVEYAIVLLEETSKNLSGI